MYIEASNKRAGDNAVLSKILTLRGQDLCLTFFYHMIGHYIGSLNVYVGFSKVFSKTGQYGFTWNKAVVPLAQTGSQKVASILNLRN
jgi:hypothetical protein